MTRYFMTFAKVSYCNKLGVFPKSGEIFKIIRFRQNAANFLNKKI